LRRRAFKQAPTTAAKKGVATKQHRRAIDIRTEKRDVTGGVTGHIDHLPLQTQCLHAVTLLQTLKRLRHVFTRWAEDGSASAIAQKVDAARVVWVVVGD